MRRLFLSIGVALLIVNCAQLPTVPEEQRVAKTELGFHLSVTNEYLKAGGVLTPEHSERADRWWRELMVDLNNAGMSNADPADIHGYVSIRLHKPLDDKGNILYTDKHTPVGGYYEQLNHSLNVPGDYDQDHWVNRPSVQALKHEMLTHWCWMTMRHFCSERGNDDPWTNHHWKAPSGQDIWDFTWR